MNNLIEIKESIKIIKLGLDVHAKSICAACIVDNASSQPGQNFTYEKLLSWVAKELSQGHKVYSCYEAGPTGYVSHRQLLKLGVENIVVQPQNWDERSKGVKTDALDAKALVLRLDRYVQGNEQAFSVVKVNLD